MFGAWTRLRFTAAPAAVLLVASLLVSFGPAPEAAGQSASTPEVGVHFHAMWSDYTHEQRSEVIDKMANAGMKWLRIDFAWASLQEDGGNDYTQWIVDWTERYAAEAHERGMKVLAVFWNTPWWANGDSGRDVPPDNLGDLRRAAEWVSTRLSDSVDAWEVWNEPNLDSFWSGSVADYVDLLKVAYPAFKSGDPTAPVVSGGVSYADAPWLTKMYDAGAKGYFDILGVHPYMAPADLAPETENGEMWTISAVGKIRALMNKRGDSNKDIWFTEFGWSAHANEYDSCKAVYNSYKDTDPNDGIGCTLNHHMGVTRKKQGEFFVRAVEYIKKMNATEGWRVTNMIWYNERDKKSGNLHEDNFGLLERDLTPKPAYFAIKDHLTGGVTNPDPEPSPSPSPTTDEPSPEPSPSPTEDGTEPDEPVDVPSETNLLDNGGFESGLEPWTARKASVYLVSDSYSGDRASFVKSRRRSRALVSGRVRMDQPTVVEATGAARVARAGQRIKLVVVESRNGRTIDRWGLWVRVQTDGWTELPTLSYLTKGNSSVRLKLRMRSRTGRYFWADELQLAPR